MRTHVDLMEALGQIVAENTRYFQSDFDMDLRRLTWAAMEPKREDRCFYWMSRPLGTWCVREREVFLRGTDAHQIWTYYQNEAAGIRACRVEVTGVEDGRLLGNVQPFSYRRQLQRLQQAALPTAAVEVTFSSGFASTGALGMFMEWPARDPGPLPLPPSKVRPPWPLPPSGRPP